MVETVIVASQHRSQYYGNSRNSGLGRFGSFGYPPRKGFGDINHRSSQSADGIPPTPVGTFATSITKQAFSPRTPSPSPNCHQFGEAKCSRGIVKGRSVIPIPTNINADPNESSYSVKSPKTPKPSVRPHCFGQVNHSLRIEKFSSIPIPAIIKADPSELAYSELWAGPTYSNSPPPSSLPIPKFSSRPKRTVSLDLPSSSAPNINFFPIAKSAPASPTRVDNPFSRNLCGDDDSATKTLRRILNLDSADE